MSAEKDQTDQFRFENEQEAIDYAEHQIEPGMVVKLDAPMYADKPFMFVAYSWVKSAKKIDEEN